MNCDFDIRMEQPKLHACFGQVYEPSMSSMNYNELKNKPQIEGVTLEGNKTFEQLGRSAMTIQEIEKILYLN